MVGLYNRARANLALTNIVFSLHPLPVLPTLRLLHPFALPFLSLPLAFSLAASPVTEAEFKMFKQAMGEQGLTKSSVRDVSFHTHHAHT